jgi:hypothetical protein
LRQAMEYQHKQSVGRVVSRAGGQRPSATGRTERLTAGIRVGAPHPYDRRRRLRHELAERVRSFG